VRPQDLVLATGGGESMGGTVETVELVGWEAFILVRVGEATLTVRVEAPVAAGLAVGQSLSVALAQPSGLLLFDSDSQRALRPAPAAALAAHAS
jgi:ABC-type sugar transport system ATPase subunit